jgi:hypothetical protein
LRSGILSAPAQAMRSVAPFLFGVLLDRLGVGALMLTTALSLAACLSLFLLRARAVPAAA